MEAQEIFDTVAKHLAQQGCRSVTRDGESCVYRGPRGRMCAVGKLIRKNEYKRSMEGRGVETLGYDLPPRLRPHITVLLALQEAHDRDGGLIRHRLLDVAGRYDLSPAILDTLTFPEVWV